jgi:acyl-CoA synthetase (AMP-forming)/AMP-acid ligase II
VLGAPDEQRGEQVVAFVVPRRPGEADAAELKAWCRRRLAVYKLPRRLVLAEELPKLPTGKVDRRALAARLAGGRH